MDKSVTCAEIQTPLGFLYVVLPVIMNHTNNPDCEQSWYLEDGHLIADPSDPQALSHPAAAVKSDHLVTSLCVNLNHQIICHSADGTPFRREIKFRVRNETAVIPNPDDLNEVTSDLQPTDQFWSNWATFFIALLLPMISILMCSPWCRRILRCRMILRFVQMSECHWDTRKYSEKRDPEADVQEKLRSDENECVSLRDPEADVQEKLRSDENGS